MGRRKEINTGFHILNVCDAEPYEFNEVIRVFKKSGIRPNGPVISLPLPFIWLASRIAGGLFRDKRKWLHSCYEKLASSMVFDNKKMLKTGFKPRHSLQTIFSPQIPQISQKNDELRGSAPIGIMEWWNGGILG